MCRTQGGEDTRAPPKTEQPDAERREARPTRSSAHTRSRSRRCSRPGPTLDAAGPRARQHRHRRPWSPGIRSGARSRRCNLTPLPRAHARRRTGGAELVSTAPPRLWSPSGRRWAICPAEQSGTAYKRHVVGLSRRVQSTSPHGHADHIIRPSARFRATDRATPPSRGACAAPIRVRGSRDSRGAA